MVVQQPKANISKKGYIRWPRMLADCIMPPEWKPIDLKLCVLLVQKMDLDDLYGVSKIDVRDARKFLGATKTEIMDSICRLMDHPITVTYPESDPAKHHVVFPNGLYLGSGRYTPCVSGVFDTELCWKFDTAFVNLLDDTSHYGRVHLETVRELTSFAALRLYMKLCEVKDSHRKLAWQPAMSELMALLGCGAMRVDNFHRRLETAMAEIERTNAFKFESKPEMWKRSASGRGRRISFVEFEFSGSGFGRPVPRDSDGKPVVLTPERDHLAEMLSLAACRQNAATAPVQAAPSEPAAAYEPAADVLGQLLLAGDHDEPVETPRQKREREIMVKGKHYFDQLESEAKYWAEQANDHAASEDARASAHEHSENLYQVLADAKQAAMTNPHWRAPRDLRGIDIFTGKLAR
jgi:hypothetical protein